MKHFITTRLAASQPKSLLPACAKSATTKPESKRLHSRGITVASLAKEMGVTRGTFYRRIGDPAFAKDAMKQVDLSESRPSGWSHFHALETALF